MKPERPAINSNGGLGVLCTAFFAAYLCRRDLYSLPHILLLFLKVHTLELLTQSVPDFTHQFHRIEFSLILLHRASPPVVTGSPV